MSAREMTGWRITTWAVLLGAVAVLLGKPAAAAGYKATPEYKAIADDFRITSEVSASSWKVRPS